MSRVKALCRALILFMFVYGQIGATAHAHEHDDEAHHEVCEYCILAVADDDEGAQEYEKLGGPDFTSISDVYELDFVLAQQMSVVALRSHEIQISFNRFTGPARAPPFIEHLS